MDITEPLAELQKILDGQINARKKPVDTMEATASSDPRQPSSTSIMIASVTRLSSSQVYVLTIDAAHGDIEHMKSELNNLGKSSRRKTIDGRSVTSSPPSWNPT